MFQANLGEMEKRIILGILSYLIGGVEAPLVLSLILLFIKLLYPFYETWKNNDTKLEEIKSNERIEKMKLKADRKKRKSAN